MGKRIIPEQVSYFCDVCGSKIHELRANDFVINVRETGYDLQGCAVGGTNTEYQLCGNCKGSFHQWIKANSGETPTP